MEPDQADDVGVHVVPTPAILSHGLRPMRGRDPLERNRVATPLELLFDLTFVAGFSMAADQASHYAAEAHWGTALGGLGIAGLLENIGDVFDAFGVLGIWGYIPMVLLWIILGYFTFAAITGGLAATVSRQEDLGAIQTPVIFLQLVPLYVAMYLVPYQPEATITKVLSYIPGLSPYLMPMRAATVVMPAVTSCSTVWLSMGSTGLPSADST